MFGGELGWSASLRNRNHICAGCNIFGLAGSLMPTSPAGRWSGWPRGPLGPKYKYIFFNYIRRAFGPSACRDPSGWSYGQRVLFSIGPGDPSSPETSSHRIARSHVWLPLWRSQGSIFGIFSPLWKASKNHCYFGLTPKPQRWQTQSTPARPVSARGVQQIKLLTSLLVSIFDFFFTKLGNRNFVE